MSANPVDDRSDMESLPAHRVPHEAPSSSPVESSAHHLPTLSDPTPPTIAMRPAESYVEDTLAPRSDAGEQEQRGLSQEKVGMAQSAPDTPNQLKDQQVLEEITKGVAGIKGFEDPSSIVTEPASQRGSAGECSVLPGSLEVSRCLKRARSRYLGRHSPSGPLRGPSCPDHSRPRIDASPHWT